MSTKKTILKYLSTNHAGAENAILAGRLCDRIGITGRLLRGAINDLRVEGHPICSDTNGYFYAASLEEIDNTISHLASRAKEMDIARDGLSKSKADFSLKSGHGGEKTT